MTIRIIWANILVFLGLLFLLEATGQLIALVCPSYDVLALQPDNVLGWKQVPNLRWTWAGHDWYASDFSVRVETNALGFRDIARDFPKPPGVKRVALLGDSFIEALQVPFEKTAGQILEQSLNRKSEHIPRSLLRGERANLKIEHFLTVEDSLSRRGGTAGSFNTSSDQALDHSQRWEVFNFGISNYGVGQYLLTWEQYARRYEPDYVIIFVAKFHMQRTVRKYEYGAFPESKKKRLWIRPIFRVENDVLIRETAKDFGEFVKVQEELINTEFSGQRSRRKKRLITVYYARRLKYLLTRLVRHFDHSSEQITTPSITDPDAEAKLFTVNLKIIEELGRNAASAGSRLVVLDASKYFGDHEAVSIALKELCSKHGFGYIPLYEDLLKADMHGVLTRWAHDNHFNKAGNEILAKVVFGWIAQDSPASEAP